MAHPLKRKELVRIEVDMDSLVPRYFWYSTPSKAQIEKEILEQLSHLQQMLDSHKEFDHIRVEAIHKTTEYCSACDREWELAEEDGVKYCAWCGADYILPEGTNA
jgi:hypothetical protein